MIVLVVVLSFGSEGYFPFEFVVEADLRVAETPGFERYTCEVVLRG